MSEVTPGLRDHLDMLAAKAERGGANLWDVLNAAQVLYTEDRRRWDRTHTLMKLREELEGRSMLQLLGEAYRRGNATPKDMLRSIKELIDERIELAREGKA